MAMNTRRIREMAGLLVLLAVAGCGGGGGSGSSSSTPSAASTDSNVLVVTVKDIPSATAYTVNMPYASVTICEPGSTSNCKTIDYVLVDTGSYGLRILSSALGSSPALPQQTDGGDALLECVAFVSGYTWGSVRVADVQLGGLKASSLPIQIISDPAAPTAPAACQSKGTAMDSVARLGANGILGIGPFLDDVGDYYTCPGGICSRDLTVSISKQVVNPVAALPSDNNGVILDMPVVAPTGAATLTGSLILGIGTRANNSLGSATVFDLDMSGDLKTTYSGSTITAFIDSGSNGLFFDDATITVCDGTSHAPGFFCPSSLLALSAILRANANGNTATLSFGIDNASNLVTTGNTAFNSLGAPWGGGTSQFDWGMPFFYGRRVYYGIYGNTISGHPGPFVAF